MKEIIKLLYFLIFYMALLGCTNISFSEGKETLRLPLLSCQIELLLPQNEFRVQKYNYEEGVFYILSDRRGENITVFEGGLMQFLPEDTLHASQIVRNKKRTVFMGGTDSVCWRKDSVGNVRLYYNRVEASRKKLFDMILKSAKIKEISRNGSK